MEEIKRVPEAVSGVKDGVQMEAKCVHTRYFKNKLKQMVLPCSVMASWENGVLSINYTAQGQRQSIGVRLDELLVLLQEANAARIEAAQKEGGKVEE